MRTRLTILLLLETAVIAFLVVQLIVVPMTEPTTIDRSESPAPAATAAAPTPSADITGANMGPIEATPLESARTELPLKLDPDDPVGILLTGTVRWHDGSPATASVLARSGNRHRGTQSDQEGTIAIIGLHPGEWAFTIRAEDAAEQTFQHTLTAAPIQSHDFVLGRSFTLQVRIVTPAGKDATRALRRSSIGIEYFHVVAQRERLPDQIALSIHRAPEIGDALWQPEPEPIDGDAGKLQLPESPPAHVGLLLGSRLVEQQLVRPAQESVTFTIDVNALVHACALVSGRVVAAETGLPVRDARVEVDAYEMDGGEPVDSDGRFRRRAYVGIHRLTITAPDFERYAAPLRVGSEAIDLGEIHLDPVQPLVGKVVDTDGNPVAARLTWTELKWRTLPTEFITNRSTRAGTDGTFSLPGTGKGRIAVLASTHDARIAVGVFDNPPLEPVELRVAPGSVCVITRPVDPTRAFTVTMFDNRRNPVAVRRLEPNRLQAMFVLPAGTYAFEVHEDHAGLVQSGTKNFGAAQETLVIL